MARSLVCFPGRRRVVGALGAGVLAGSGSGGVLVEQSEGWRHHSYDEQCQCW